MKELIVRNIVGHLDVYGCVMDFRLFVDGKLIDTIQVFSCSELDIPGTRFKIIRALLNTYKLQKKLIV